MHEFHTLIQPPCLVEELLDISIISYRLWAYIPTETSAFVMSDRSLLELRPIFMRIVFLSKAEKETLLVCNLASNSGLESGDR